MGAELVEAAGPSTQSQKTSAVDMTRSLALSAQLRAERAGVEIGRARSGVASAFAA